MLVFLSVVAFAEPNFARALDAMQDKKVDYHSSLGEGEQAFDPRPRTIQDTVNCMTWMQGVIASAYGETPKEVAQYLDSVRYYGDAISFGTRKHYIDRWLALEPAPLLAIEQESCRSNVIGSVALDLERFKQNHGYKEEMFAEDRSRFSLDFLTPDKMSGCLASLPRGYYALFFVASAEYLQYWGRHGAMGQVHSMIVHKDERLLIYHASVDFQKVIAEDWEQFHSRLSGSAQGYTIFAFDPMWKPKNDMKVAPQGRR